jgi:hypothetical protein
MRIGYSWGGCNMVVNSSEKPDLEQECAPLACKTDKIFACQGGIIRYNRHRRYRLHRQDASSSGLIAYLNHPNVI